jgi:ThiF family
MHSEYSVALPMAVDQALKAHLIRANGQEDLVFALWTPSDGALRRTALIHTPLFPRSGEREVHGNASFHPEYFERVCRGALREDSGIALLHSHPFRGWQAMSADDVRAEEKLAGAVAALTGLQLVGVTVGSDGTWSARVWEHASGRTYERSWCVSVRTVGEQLGVDFADIVLPPPAVRELSRRTVTVWGESAHARLARLRIGIVGLGSVGSLVAEALARMGFERFVLMDFDRVKPHNLDRLVIATEADVGRLKVDVADQRIRAVATAARVDVRPVPWSIVEEQGYYAALDCDVLFSCVDRPRPVDHRPLRLRAPDPSN